MQERKRIDLCDFSVRTINLLSWPSYGAEKITYLDELTDLTVTDLRERSRIGIKSIREIRKVLASEGLSLKGDILFDSEAEKKLIQDMPKLIQEISCSLRELERKISWIRDKLDELHCNMQPNEK